MQPYRATASTVENYWRLFVNRRAYVLQSMRPHLDSGRHYYFRPKGNKDGDPLSLNSDIIRQHLEGHITVGLYAVNPATQRCKWIAVDGDYNDSLKHLCALQWELRQLGVESALEQSRRGAHLWIFGEHPLLARECRALISGVAQQLGVPVKGAGTAEGVEIFPKHDEVKDGDFGNAIRGPLGIHRTVGARFWFYGADYDLDRQVAFLAGVKKLAEDKLSTMVRKLGQPSAPSITETRSSRHWHLPERRREFRILDHVEVRRKSGRNWITRCPSCAAAGHDRSGDNLAISVDEPQKYICWAGCTKEMIRASLGCPILERTGVAYATR